MLEAKTIKDIKEPKRPKQKKTPKRFDDGAKSHVYSTPKDLFRHHYFDVLDLIIGELTNRLDQPTFAFIQNVEKLFIDAANGHEVSITQEIRKCYENDVDFDRLKQQLQRLPDLCSNFFKVTNVDTIVQVLVESDSRAIRSLFSEVTKLLKLYLTIPITSSTSERSFSALRQIKTYLRNTMGQERMNHAITCFVHGDRTSAVD